MNTKLTPQECLDLARWRIDALVNKGACVKCAINLTADRYEIDPEKLETLYWDSWPRYGTS